MSRAYLYRIGHLPHKGWVYKMFPSICSVCRRNR